MTQTQRAPMRSALFVPAANGRAVEKSATLPADVLIFDLEDSAAPAEKSAARERLAAYLRATGGAALRVLRVNAPGEADAAADLALAAGLAIDAVLLPKVESAAGVLAAAEALRAAGAPAALALWAMIETPVGILAAPSIAAAAAGLAQPLGALVVGPNDIVLATDLRPGPERAEILPWLTQIVLAAKANGLAVLDGVYNDFGDQDGFAAECRQARRLGFTGKTLIHPAQIDEANRAFAPGADELAHARAVMDAFARPENENRGVVQIEGRMVERLHLRQAEALLLFNDTILRRQTP